MTPPILPTDAAARKAIPVYSGVLKYFPRAIAAVAELSKVANDQHNPGQPMHWAREKSKDHHDCIARHLLEAGTVDPVDHQRHSTKLAWRALAALELELEGLAVEIPASETIVSRPIITTVSIPNDGADWIVWDGRRWQPVSAGTAVQPDRWYCRNDIARFGLDVWTPVNGRPDRDLTPTTTHGGG